MAMSSYPGSPSWVRVVFAPDQKAAFRSAAAVFTDQLIPLIPDVPAAALEGMRGDGVKSAARRAHALELMGSHKDVVPPSVSPERLADAQASVSDIDELLVPLERTVHRLRNYRRQCVHVGDTQVSGFTESARTGARMGQASAQRVVDEMAPYTARKRARKAADGSEVDGEFDDSDDESLNEA
jgi:hypothetical protein